MIVFLASMDRKDTRDPWYEGDALDELLDHAESHMMFDSELVLPYFYWIQALFFHLRQRKETLEAMTKSYDEGREKMEQKS